MTARHTEGLGLMEHGNRQRLRIVAAAIVATFLSGSTAIPVFAHHSYAMFDETKTVTIEGLIEKFQWTAPHSWIDVQASGQNGAKGTWSLETGPPSHLSRRGWNKTSLKFGDRVVVSFHPNKAGTMGGALISVKKVDTGEVFLHDGPLQRRDAR